MSRKGILDDQEIVQSLKEIILEYDENHNVNAKIKYKDIYEYTKLLSLQKKIDFEYPSYTWWKTAGKKMIDDYNKVKTKTIKLTEKDEIDIPDIMDIIYKFGGVNKEKLTGHFKPLEVHIARLVEKINDQHELINRLENNLKRFEDEKEKQKTVCLKLQSILLSLFLYSKKTKATLFNMMETGENHNDIVNMSLTRTFQSPKEFIDLMINNIDIEHLSGLMNKSNKERVNKVLQYPNNNIKKYNSNEYDW
jgi:signal recognition particle subunit SEC65